MDEWGASSPWPDTFDEDLAPRNARETLLRATAPTSRPPALMGVADREPIDGARHPVPIERREGVFVHVYRCRACQIKWAVFSWLADPPQLRSGATTCPWCHDASPAIHERVTVSREREFSMEHPEREVAGIVARLAAGARLMADSPLGPFDGYAGDPADRD
jgi:hypothetical protein